MRVLLVSDIKQRSSGLDRALEEIGHSVVAGITTSDDLDSWAGASQPEVIVVSVDAPTPAILNQIGKVNRERPCPVVMFAGNSGSGATRAAVKAGISAYIVNGFSRERLRPILEIAVTRFAELQGLKQELHKTKSALAERKLVDRAKGMLMKHHGLAEDDAYRALRKMAMDRTHKK